ncbi:hypothetical protein OG948_17470 [Embleya sp. NBC_00888]|uniref:hypothetical protein n=1 Tax=Embleya sp. NBC_00888 TaxID=2975960 RepID=UPI0038692833|nr:hypothetical protein OG948_17470 [Embleya sp. NBC_00888]
MKPADEGSPEPEHLPDLRKLSALLERWRMEPWAEIAEAARTAGMLLRDHLVASGRWETLPAGEQAAVQWAMATGHVLVTKPRRHRYLDEDGARLHRLAEIARHVADLCDGWTHGERARDARRAEDVGRRMAALPHGWRGEAMRRVMDGEDPLAVVAEASIALNILRNVYGIDARIP